MSNIITLPNEARENMCIAGAVAVYAERAGRAFDRVVRLSGRTTPQQAAKVLSTISDFLELAEQALTVTSAAEESPRADMKG